VARYLIRRLPSALAVLILASVLIFLLIRLVPGDPATTLAGPGASPQALAELRSELGLDHSVVSQYFSWVGSVVTLDFGRSYVIGGEIGTLIAEGLGNTLVLAGAALLIALVLSLLAGLSAVIFDNRWLNAIIAAFNTAGLALPTFVTGPILILVLAVLLPVFPAGGTPSEGLFQEPVATLEFLILPAFCLGLPVAAALSRFLTESLRTQMRQPYVMTAEALGISRRRIVLTQVLRNALPAAVTALGIQVGYLLGGAVLVETIFAWPGLGQLIEKAISGRDYPLVQILLLLSVVVFVVIQLATDLIHAYLDPRVRLGGRTG
jgi:peptide/nickel transport system permease protein